jgi:hypothetical protein
LLTPDGREERRHVRIDADAMASPLQDDVEIAGESGLAAGALQRPEGGIQLGRRGVAAEIPEVHAGHDRDRIGALVPRGVRVRPGIGAPGDVYGAGMTGLRGGRSLAGDRHRRWGDVQEWPLHSPAGKQRPVLEPGAGDARGLPTGPTSQVPAQGFEQGLSEFLEPSQHEKILKSNSGDATGCNLAGVVGLPIATGRKTTIFSGTGVQSTGGAAMGNPPRRP